MQCQIADLDCEVRRREATDILAVTGILDLPDRPTENSEKDGKIEEVILEGKAS
jgi:hypothetical protein